MNEYIYSSRGTPMQDVGSEISLPRERIVRCRDCIHSIDGDRCNRWSEEYWMEVEPDGFCAWGESKAIDEPDTIRNVLMDSGLLISDTE